MACNGGPVTGDHRNMLNSGNQPEMVCMWHGMLSAGNNSMGKSMVTTNIIITIFLWLVMVSLKPMTKSWHQILNRNRNQAFSHPASYIPYTAFLVPTVVLFFMLSPTGSVLCVMIGHLQSGRALPFTAVLPTVCLTGAHNFCIMCERFTGCFWWEVGWDPSRGCIPYTSLHSAFALPSVRIWSIRIDLLNPMRRGMNILWTISSGISSPCHRICRDLWSFALGFLLFSFLQSSVCRVPGVFVLYMCVFSLHWSQ